MGSECNPNKPSKYIQYLDANNLYGWAMSQLLHDYHNDLPTIYVYKNENKWS